MLKRRIHISWKIIISILPLLCVFLHYLPWLVLEDYNDPIWDCENRFNGFFNYTMFLSFLGFVLSPALTVSCVYLDCSKICLLPILGMQILEAFWTILPTPLDTSYSSVWWLSYIFAEIVLFVFYFIIVFVIMDKQNKERLKMERQLEFIKNGLSDLKFSLNV